MMQTCRPAILFGFGPFARRAAAGMVLAAALASPAAAELIRLEVTSRLDVPEYGYERLTGKAHFRIDPADAHNTVVADLARAPHAANGKVEFTADFYMLKPKNGGNQAVLLDVVNRGRKTVLTGFNRASGAVGSDGVEQLGDGFLMRRGFTVVGVGWEFDIASRDGAVRIDAPAPRESNGPVVGIARGTFIPDSSAPMTVGDLSGYKALRPDAPENTLSVRDRVSDTPRPIARERWSLSGNQVTLQGGFEPGKIYELAYAAESPQVAGLGLVAVRDMGAWMKTAPEAGPARYAYAFGSSQSGRFLRTFLYQGFNSDERDRQVFDGVMAHIAGAARIDLNRRWSVPVALDMYAATAFPFADQALRDPVSGMTDGLLDNPRARRHQPKVFYTNTGVEYWGGGRSAALVHTTPDGTQDLSLPDNVRVYFLAGAQHGPGRFPPETGNGQQAGNPTDYWWAMRALLVGMDRWVRDGAAPPASQYPRIDRGTLVGVTAVAFPAIPGVPSPKMLTGGTRIVNTLATGGAGAGAALPLLVPQVDADGNETSGLKLPEVAVPLATHTGWNFRKPSIGAPDQLLALQGSYLPFAPTAAARAERRDPRPSVAERYAARDSYLRAIQDVAASLVKAGYLLEGDVSPVVKRATDHWDLATTSRPTATANR